MVDKLRQFAEKHSSLGAGTNGCCSFTRSRSPAQAGIVDPEHGAESRQPDWTLMARASSRRAVRCEEPGTARDVPGPESGAHFSPSASGTQGFARGSHA